MAYTPALSYYLGPLAVYNSPTGMTDINTGIPYLGGSLHEGDYVDATVSEIAQWNVRFGANLNTGRYRLVRVSPRATYSNIGYGTPVGWAVPQNLSGAAITAAGTGSGSGTVLCASTTSGGVSATVLVSVAAGVITGVQLVYAGSGFTSVPTFGLTEISAAGITTSGTIQAQMNFTPNVVSSFDSSAVLTTIRGISLCTITAAQITAGAWIVIQEQGIAPLLVTTATDTAAYDVAYATTGATVVTNVPTSWHEATIGHVLDVSAAGYLNRVSLELPLLQG